MDLLLSTRTALRNLRRTNLRSSLTTLGIVIGVAAMVAVVSVGNGARAYVEDTLTSLESNQLQITAAPPRGQWRNAVRRGLAPGDGLTLDDYKLIRRDVRGVEAATVRTYGSVPRSSATMEPFRFSANGIDREGFRVLGRRIVRGTGFSDTDVRAHARVCVLPEFLAQARFGDADPIGEVIRIADNPFTVIGVMEDGATFRERAPEDPGDLTAYVPYTTFLRRLNREARIAIILRAHDPAELERIRDDVSNLLERRRGSRTAQFTTDNVSEVVNRQTNATRTLTLLMGGIGAVSLLVGGIGVMNVMFFCVTERTREIGIRIALGTRARTVMRMFVIEAIALSLCGGVVGVVAGICLTWLTAYISEWPVLITPATICLALLCTTVIGVFFGYYPARRASNLDPVQALRAD